jgi:hypothetical protein
MADANYLLNGQVSNILNFFAAASALGTAAYGLVDASKAFGGGISNAGFSHIREAVVPLIAAPEPAAAQRFDRKHVLATLLANWLNGVPKADQKAAAKSLIHMAVTPENAERLAKETGIDVAKMEAIAGKIRNGERLLENEISVLGRFDVIVSAVLDEAYERADQKYRNYSKLAGCVVATVLAAIGGGIIYVDNGGSGWVYPQTHEFLLSVLVGLIATPLAPVAKDLSSAIAAAVKTVGFIKSQRR